MNLITGASGFLGMNLAIRLLQQGEAVRVLVRNPAKVAFLDSFARGKQLEVLVGDLEDQAGIDAACKGARTVFHSAALVSSWNANWKQAWRSNLIGTRRVLKAARNAERTVYVSTVDVFGLGAEGSMGDENTAWNYPELGLENPYSSSKRRAHLAAVEASRTQNIAIVCPGYMIGPRDLNLSSNRLVLAAATGPAFAPYGGNSFVHVEDVVDALLAVRTSGESGATWVVAAESLAYKQLFTMISSLYGRPRRFARYPRWVTSLVGEVCEAVGFVTKKEPQIHRHVSSMGNIFHYYDGSRATRELGISYRPISRAVEECLEWFRSQGVLKD